MAVWDRQEAVSNNPLPIADLPGKKPKITIGIPHTESATLMWLMRMLAPLVYVALPWADKVPQMVRGVPQSVARDQIVEISLKDPNITHILWVDTDNITVKEDGKGGWNYLDPNIALNMLLQVNQPIVSGLYRAKQKEGFNWAAWMDAKLPDRKGFVPIQSWTGNFFQVDVIGMGFCLVKREVYENVDKPWHPWPEQSPSEDFNFCCPPDTIVFGTECRQIDQLHNSGSNHGWRVCTHSGSLQPVIDTMVRDYVGDLVSIKVLGSELKVTPNHPILIKTKHRINSTRGPGQVLWKRADKVSPGDWVFMPIPKNNKHKISRLNPWSYLSSLNNISKDDSEIFFKKTRNSAVYIPVSIPLDSDLLRLFGYYIAEGCVSGKKYGMTLTFGHAENNLAEDAANLLQKYFNAHSTISKTVYGIRVDCSSKSIGVLFSAMLGQGAANKHFPKFTYELNLEQLSELVKGYWLGDGNKNGYSASTISRRLAYDLQQSLLRLGILSSVVGKYHVNVNSHFYEQFSNAIGIGSKHNAKQVSHLFKFVSAPSPGFWLKINKVSKSMYCGKVYNLTVNKKNSYVAQGISVHNCIKAREKGYKINVFSDVKMSHIGTLNIFPDGKISVLDI